MNKALELLSLIEAPIDIEGPRTREEQWREKLEPIVQQTIKDFQDFSKQYCYYTSSGIDTLTSMLREGAEKIEIYLHRIDSSNQKRDVLYLAFKVDEDGMYWEAPYAKPNKVELTPIKDYTEVESFLNKNLNRREIVKISLMKSFLNDLVELLKIAPNDSQWEYQIKRIAPKYPKWWEIERSALSLQKNPKGFLTEQGQNIFKIYKVPILYHPLTLDMKFGERYGWDLIYDGEKLNVDSAVRDSVDDEWRRDNQVEEGVVEVDFFFDAMTDGEYSYFSNFRLRLPGINEMIDINHEIESSNFLDKIKSRFKRIKND